MSGLYNASLTPYISNVTFSKFMEQLLIPNDYKGCKNDRRGLVPSPASCIQPLVSKIITTNNKNNKKYDAYQSKKGKKQVKKKEFKIMQNKD